VARHEADYSIAKVAMVVAGLTLGTFLISALAGPHIGKFTILVNLAFICFMLMTFCWITLRKSIVVVALYSCFYVATFFAGQAIRNRISASMDTPMIEKRNEDIDAIKQEMLRQQQMFAGVKPARSSDLPPLPATNSAALELLPTITGEESTGIVAVVAETAAPPARIAAPIAPPRPPVRPVKVDPVVPAPVAAVVSNTPAAPIEDAIWGEARKKLKVGGAVKDKNGKWTAYVNNALVEIGDVVSARYERLTYRWRIRSISKEGVTFDPVDSQPLK